MEVFAFLGLLVGLFVFLISNSNQLTGEIEDKLESIDTFNRGEEYFEILLLQNKLEFLYKKLILFSTLNLLISGLLLLSASAYQTQLNCIPFLIIVLVIYIPSIMITYLSYLYYTQTITLKKRYKKTLPNTRS